MKLCFSTLGCPSWPLAEILDAAKRYGFHGVELRGLEGELDLTRHPAFSRSRRRDTATAFADAGLEIVCVNSSVRLCEDVPQDKMLNEVMDLVDLASALHSGIVRVFPGSATTSPVEASSDDLSRARNRLLDRLSILSEASSGSGVAIGLECHDSFVTGEDLYPLVKPFPAESVGIIWDTGNSFAASEVPSRTLEFAGNRIIHVHMKDWRREGDRFPPVLFGDGEVPQREIVSCLSKRGYKGFLSFEWEKVWHPDLPEPETAFPGYIREMLKIIQ